MRCGMERKSTYPFFPAKSVHIYIMDETAFIGRKNFTFQNIRIAHCVVCQIDRHLLDNTQMNNTFIIYIHYTSIVTYIMTWTWVEFFFNTKYTIVCVLCEKCIKNWFKLQCQSSIKLGMLSCHLHNIWLPYCSWFTIL